MTIYVLSHKDSDGRGAEAAAYNKFNSSAVYMNVQYGEKFPLMDLTPLDEVYILDFAYDLAVLDRIANEVNKLIVIDHHDDKSDEFRARGYVIHDINKSASVLAWEYFNPGRPIPLGLRLIQDYDLWKFDYQETRAFEYGLKATNNKTPRDWWDAIVRSPEKTNKIIERGKVIETDVNNYVNYFIRNRNYKVCDWNGRRVGVFNTTVHRNEIAEALYTDVELDLDFVFSWSIKDEMKFVVSLRGKKGKAPNLITIAKKFGGGGHEQAAAFNLPAHVGFEMLLNLFNDKGV